MTLSSKPLSSVVCLSLVLVLCSYAAEKGGPATVANGIKESELTTITLTEKAEQRLGVETAPTKFLSIHQAMKLGGEIMAVPGQEARLSAPVAGTILYKELSAGMLVKKGQVVMRLSLMPPLQEMLNIEEDLKIKEAEYNLALAKANRAERLLVDKAVSEKSVQEAQAGLATATGALAIVKSRIKLLQKGADETLPALLIESPIDGAVQKIHVAPGQVVPAATPLFDVASQNPVWLKVPVYAGDLKKIAADKAIQIQLLGGADASRTSYAEPVQGPPSSDAASATMDLYYQLDNENGSYRTGQKVMAHLPLKAEQESLVVAYSSIVYDMYGGTWLYEKIAPRTYTRRRVELSHVIDGHAVLTRGIEVGDEVVVAAVAEIFGTEFGGGK
jgi:cobalt-zinc-cadmium efflux system membrane fusion protein